MPRLDKQFGEHPLDERSDWLERLTQAFDEAPLTSPALRDVIAKGLKDEYERLHIERIEEALAACRGETDPGVGLRVFVEALGSDSVQLKNREPHPLVIAARDLVFPDAPLKLFSCFFMSLGVLGLFKYLPQLYGDDIFSRDCFFEGVEAGLDRPDSDLLFTLRHCLARDIAVATGSSVAGVVEPPVTVPFVRAWHRHHARNCYEQARRFRYWLTGRFDEDNVAHVIQYVPAYVKNVHPSQLNEAIGTTRANIDDLASELIQQEIALTHRQEAEPFHSEWRHAPLTSDLGTDRARQLIEWSLDEDIAGWRKWPRPDDLFSCGRYAPLWYASPYRQDWLTALWERIDDSSLTASDRFAVLRHRIDSGFHLPYDFDDVVACQRSEEELANLGVVHDDYDDKRWWFCKVSDDVRSAWNQRFESQVDSPGLPDELLHQWVEAATSRKCDSEKIAGAASKSLGLLRKRLASIGDEFHLREYREVVDFLRRHDLQKLLRLLLLAFRSSPAPSCGPDLARPIQGNFSDPYEDAFTPPQSLIGLILDILMSPGPQQMDLMTALAEFSVSRLRLHKGEKVSNGNFTDEQCVEPSSIWRQAYLKALVEMGLDLGGKVHKTLFFVRKHDPDADVRAVASEAYKAVRRSDTQLDETSSVRACVAAMWWLRLAQRRFLELEIDTDAARRTRRRELRAIR